MAASILDVFTSGSGFFDAIAMTDSINLLPFHPRRIQQLGIFEPEGVDANTVVIEEQDGVLQLVPSQKRGAGSATEHQPGDRRGRTLEIPHVPLNHTVLAADLQGKRKFGTTDERESVESTVNNRLQQMKDSLTVTLEYMMMSALKGTVIDGADVTLYNLFTTFGITPPSDVAFALDTATTNVAEKVIEVKEAIELAMGGTPFDHVHCLCGAKFFKSLIGHDNIQFSYQFYKEAAALRQDMRNMFEFEGVIFEVYRGKVGSKDFIDESSTRVAHFFPVGGRQVFKTYYGPANFIEAVNTVGQEFYAKQKIIDFDMGIRIHTQMNPLPICTRPGALVKGTSAL